MSAYLRALCKGGKSVLDEHDLVVTEPNEFDDRIKLQNAKNDRIQDREQLQRQEIGDVADCGGDQIQN